MKLLKLGLRIWIGITSILSFLGGWALFSHAGKPAPLITNPTAVSGQETTQSAGAQFAPIPTLPPMPSLDNPATGSSLLPLPSLPNTVQPNFMPRFTTRGS